MGRSHIALTIYGLLAVLVLISTVLTVAPYGVLLLFSTGSVFQANATDVARWASPFVGYVQKSPSGDPLFVLGGHVLRRSADISDTGYYTQLSSLHAYLAAMRTSIYQTSETDSTLPELTVSLICIMGNILSRSSPSSFDIALHSAASNLSGAPAPIRITGFMRAYEDSDVIIRLMAPIDSPLAPLLARFNGLAAPAPFPLQPQDTLAAFLHYGRRVPAAQCRSIVRALNGALPMSSVSTNGTIITPLLIPTLFAAAVGPGEFWLTPHYATLVRPPDGGGSIASDHPLARSIYGTVDTNPRLGTAAPLAAWTLYNTSALSEFGGLLVTGLAQSLAFEPIAPSPFGPFGPAPTRVAPQAPAVISPPGADAFGDLWSSVGTSAADVAAMQPAVVHVHVMRRMRAVYLTQRIEVLNLYESLDEQILSVASITIPARTLTREALLAQPPPVPTIYTFHAAAWDLGDDVMPHLQRKWVLCQSAIFGVTVSPMLRIVGVLADRDCSEYFPEPSGGRIIWNPEAVVAALPRVGKATAERARALACGGGPRGSPDSITSTIAQLVRSRRGGVAADDMIDRMQESAAAAATVTCREMTPLAIALQQLHAACPDLFSPLAPHCSAQPDTNGAVPLLACLVQRCGGHGLSLAEGVPGRLVLVLVTEGRVARSGLHTVSLLDANSFFPDLTPALTQSVCSDRAATVAIPDNCDLPFAAEVCDVLTAGLERVPSIADPSELEVGPGGGMQAFVCAWVSSRGDAVASHLYRLLAISGVAALGWFVILLLVLYGIVLAAQHMWCDVFDNVRSAVLCPWQPALWSALAGYPDVVVSEMQPLVLWWRAAAMQIRARWATLPLYARFLLARDRVIAPTDRTEGIDSIAAAARGPLFGGPGGADGRPDVNTLSLVPSGDAVSTTFGAIPMLSPGTASLSLSDLSARPPAAVACVKVRLYRGGGTSSPIPAAAPVLARTLSGSLVAGAYIVWLPSCDMPGEDPDLCAVIAVPHTAPVKDAARTLHRIVTRVASALVARFMCLTSPPSQAAGQTVIPPTEVLRGYATIGVSLRTRGGGQTYARPSHSPACGGDRGLVFLGQSTAAQRAFALARLGATLNVLHGTVLADDAFINEIVHPNRAVDESSAFTPFDIISAPAQNGPSPLAADPYHPLSRAPVSARASRGAAHRGNASRLDSPSHRGRPGGGAAARSGGQSATILWVAPAQFSVSHPHFFRLLAEKLRMVINGEPYVDAHLRKLFEDYKVSVSEVESLWSILGRATDSKHDARSGHLTFELGYVEPPPPLVDIDMRHQ